ncbi:MAG: hypothetical protein ABEJ56_02055 [Candidatus Nanohaloarchaea archaeon]
MDWDRYFGKIYSEFDRYLVIPVLIVIVSVGYLGFNYLDSGEFVSKGLDFTGGTEIQFSINQSFEPAEIERTFASQGREEVRAAKQTTGNTTSLIVRLPPPQINESEAEQILREAGYEASVQSLRGLSAAVSDEFFIQAQLAFLMAFTIMSLVIFYAFKDLTPSLAVIFAAAGDILFALAGMAFFGIDLTLGSLAALLMLIGYSVDTDIVLSTRVLRQDRNSLEHRIWSSVKTGITMSSGGIAGFTILYFVSKSMVGPSELSQIASVMVMGLLADIPLTYFGNAVILKKYVEGDFSSLGEVLPWS